MKQAAGGEAEDGLDLKHLPPLMQGKKHGGMGGIPYDSQRDLESQSDALEIAHDELVPDESEDEFEQRNQENQREEKRILFLGETELQRQARQVGGLQHELPQNVVQPFGPESRAAKRKFFLALQVPEEQEFALNFKRPGRPPKKQK